MHAESIVVETPLFDLLQYIGTIMMLYPWLDHKCHRQGHLSRTILRIVAKCIITVDKQP